MTAADDLLAHEPAILDAMPAMAREIVGAIGLVPTLRLLAVYGGKRPFIAKAFDAAGPWVALLGPEAGAMFVQRFGGDHLELPMLSAVERLLRDNTIRADYDAGTSLDVLVDRFGLTRRYLRRILQAPGAGHPRCARGFEHAPLQGLLRELATA